MEQNATSIPFDTRRVERIRKECENFRILVVGRANAGKTTLLQRTCNTTDAPEIYDTEGEKVIEYSLRVCSFRSIIDSLDGHFRVISDRHGKN